jgi:hypothetical protein
MEILKLKTRLEISLERINKFIDKSINRNIQSERKTLTKINRNIQSERKTLTK